MTDRSLPHPSERVLFTELPDGESVLLDLETEAYFGLNRLGTAVWMTLDDDGDVESIVSSTCESTDVDADVVRADIAELIAELARQGLVEGP